MSSTALYMHFRDKDEILIEICSNATMEALLASNSEISGPPIDAVARVPPDAGKLVRFGFKHPNAYKLAFCSAPNAAFTERMAGANDIAERLCPLCRGGPRDRR